MRVGLSGTHGTGKSTLAADLADRLRGHRVVPEPYLLLEEDGYEFGFPPTVADYRAQLARSIEVMRQPGDLIFDRTPLDVLAYLVALGCDVEEETSGEVLRPGFASLDALVVVPVTAESRRRLPAPELPALRDAVDDALRALVYSDPLEAWSDVPVVELDGPLDHRPQQLLRLLDGLSPTRG